MATTTPEPVTTSEGAILAIRELQEHRRAGLPPRLDLHQAAIRYGMETGALRRQWCGDDRLRLFSEGGREFCELAATAFDRVQARAADTDPEQLRELGQHMRSLMEAGDWPAGRHLDSFRWPGHMPSRHVSRFRGAALMITEATARRAALLTPGMEVRGNRVHLVDQAPPPSATGVDLVEELEATIRTRDRTLARLIVQRLQELIAREEALPRQIIEALALRWSEVDLQASLACGEIIIAIGGGE